MLQAGFSHLANKAIQRYIIFLVRKIKQFFQNHSLPPTLRFIPNVRTSKGAHKSRKLKGASSDLLPETLRFLLRHILMGLFTKKKSWRRPADSNEVSSSLSEVDNCSRHRQLGSCDSDAAITDYNITDSEEDSNKQPKGAATSSDSNNFTCDRESSPVPSIQNKHRFMAIISDRRHQHFRGDKTLKRVTIAETNNEKVLEESGGASPDIHKSTQSRSAMASRNSDDDKSLSSRRNRKHAQKSRTTTNDQPIPRRKHHAGSRRNLPRRSMSKPLFQVIVNPFEYRRDVYLARDMAYVADAMNLDVNTQAMLALYDAKSLEDFSLMAPADIHDLVGKAQSMRRAIPPLQVRKIEVLREWIQEISRPKDETQIPTWTRRDRTRRGKSRRLIPRDWKEQFESDLPRLKQKLQALSSTLSIFPMNSFAPNFRILTMCGLVE